MCSDSGFRLARTAILALLTVFAASANSQPVVPGSARGNEFELLNELVVSTDKTIWPDNASLVAQVAARHPAILARVANPIGARELISVRILPSMLSEMDANDPRRLLHDAIVLTYADKASTDFAETVLRVAAGVRSVFRGRSGSYSAPPNDPLLATNADIKRYQWGANRMGFVSAWDKVKGTAYAAVLDNGIQTKGISPNVGIHPDLVDNYRPHFSQNFNLNNAPGGAPNTADNLDEEPFSTNLFAGHGTHTAGIVGGRGNNGIGITGMCFSCSLLIGRVSKWVGFPYNSYAPDDVAVTAGINMMTSIGAQVISNSFGLPDPVCSTNPIPLFCAALDAANTQDTVVVAAAGNGRSTTTIDFPARHPTVVPVGGVEYHASGVQFWFGGFDQQGNAFGSNWNSSIFVAPARDVISSTYTNRDWNPNAPYDCGDNFPASFALGYGVCTGTSMAAPHVAGLVALIRSADPLLTSAQVKSILTSAAKPCVNSQVQCGKGMPDAGQAVTSAFGGPNVKNRLTPLFSFYSPDRGDHFYTVVPQMGAVAILGTLLPKSYSGSAFSYQTIGPLTPNFTGFVGVPCAIPPCPTRQPRAMVSVFTSFKSPAIGGADLVPLRRLSWGCPNSSQCSNPHQVSHVYSTEPTENWASVGYKLDGIEGYVYSKTLPQPPGTVKLCRKYDLTRDDYILFPGGAPNGTSCAATSDGYTSGGNYNQSVLGTDWIGWVYTARASAAICSGGIECKLLSALFLLLND